MNDARASLRANAGVPLATLAGHLRRRLAACIRRARRRARLRRDLERLDTHLLHDIGVRREDLVREAYRPFWRP